MISVFRTRTDTIDDVTDSKNGLTAISCLTTIEIELKELHTPKLDCKQDLYREAIEFLTKLLNSEATK